MRSPTSCVTPAGPAVTGAKPVLCRIRANGQPALAHYIREAGEDGGHLSGIFVLTLAGAQIAVLTRFAASNIPPQFALPATLDWPPGGGLMA